MSSYPSNEFVQDLGYDVVLPCHLLVNRNLEPNAKLLYGVIRNLTKIEGYCFANNKYLAERMDCDISSVKRWLHGLEEEGYLEVEHDTEGFGYKRKLFISDNFKKSLQRLKKEPPPAQKESTPSAKMGYIKEDNLKEDIYKKNSSSSSSLPPSDPGPTKPPDPKEMMRRKISSKISFTEEEFEEAYARYSRLDEKKVVHPIAWFEAVIFSIRKAGSEKIQAQTSTESKNNFTIFEKIKKLYAEIPGIFWHGRDYFEFCSGPASESMILRVHENAFLEQVISRLRKMGIYRNDL